MFTVELLPSRFAKIMMVGCVACLWEKFCCSVFVWRTIFL